MYGSSTQKENWIYAADELTSLRVATNNEYISCYSGEDGSSFLTANEELLLLRCYLRRLRLFCREYRDLRDPQISLPECVTSTATHYLNRFYLHNSVMSHLPKYMMYTCVFLACKIEEVYIPMADFLHNVDKFHEQHMEQLGPVNVAVVEQAILNSELHATQSLGFNLIVHGPHRPLDGMLIDIKSRWPGQLPEGQDLRAMANSYLDTVHLTDAILMFSPSQMAVAAMTAAATKCDSTIDDYIINQLLPNRQDLLKLLIDAVRGIKKAVKMIDTSKMDLSLIQSLEDKLELCHDRKNNPATKEYSAKQYELMEQKEDDDELLKDRSHDDLLREMSSEISHQLDASM